MNTPSVDNLVKAILDVRRATVHQLLQAGIDPNLSDSEGRISLDVALDLKDSEILKLLIQGGADVDKITPAGLSIWDRALTDMQFVDDGADIERLVASGVPIDHPNKKGNTPLLLAARASACAVDRMLRLGASPNHANKDGATPLILASASDSADYQDEDGPRIVQMLLDAGAHVNARGCDGKDALEIALQQDENPGVAERIVVILRSHKKYTK